MSSMNFDEAIRITMDIAAELPDDIDSDGNCHRSLEVMKPFMECNAKSISELSSISHDGVDEDTSLENTYTQQQLAINMLSRLLDSYRHTPMPDISELPPANVFQETPTGMLQVILDSAYICAISPDEVGEDASLAETYSQQQEAIDMLSSLLCLHGQALDAMECPSPTP